MLYGITVHCQKVFHYATSDIPTIYNLHSSDNLSLLYNRQKHVVRVVEKLIVQVKDLFSYLVHSILGVYIVFLYTGCTASNREVRYLHSVFTR